MNRSVAVGIASILLASPMAGAKEKAPPVEIPKGAQIGVVNLLDPELMQYHSAPKTEDKFFKIYPVGWSLEAMVTDSVTKQLQEKGLTAVPLAMSTALAHEREDCFVNSALADGLPRNWSKNCSGPLAQLAASAGVKAVIVFSAGLNNPDHAGSDYSDTTSRTLRGWGIFTRERDSAGKPLLFDETEMLMIGFEPDGSARLVARKWGGTLSVQWENYVKPADPKQLTPEQLDELQPLFAAVLDRQSKELVDQVHVEQ